MKGPAHSYRALRNVALSFAKDVSFFLLYPCDVDFCDIVARKFLT